jgi:hypothetical protein
MFLTRIGDKPDLHQQPASTLDLYQCCHRFFSNDRRMEQSADDKKALPRHSRTEEARQILEEYARDLREIIKALLRRLN